MKVRAAFMLTEIELRTIRAAHGRGGKATRKECVTFIDRAVRDALKPGARFILETPMVLENLLGHIQDRAWWQVGDVHLLVENRYDHQRSRLEIDYTFISDGRIETRHGSHRAYSFRELVQLIEAAGFSVELDRPWTRDAHSLTFAVRK